MPLPWIAVTIGVAAVSYILSDDDSDDERARERNRENRREAREAREVFEAEKKSQQVAEKLKHAKRLINTFFQAHYGAAPESIRYIDNCPELYHHLQSHIKNPPIKVEQATTKMQLEMDKLTSINQLISMVENLKNNG